jgi:hypothetical protein
MAIFRGNCLEALAGAWKGQHSIRINDQFRICLVWRDGDAFDVAIVDYHGECTTCPEQPACRRFIPARFCVRS